MQSRKRLFLDSFIISNHTESLSWPLKFGLSAGCYNGRRTI